MNPKCWCGHTLEQHTFTGLCKETCNECECKSFTIKDDRASAPTEMLPDIFLNGLPPGFSA